MKPNFWKLVLVMVILTVLVSGLVACAPKETPAPAEPVSEEAAEEPEDEQVAAESEKLYHFYSLSNFRPYHSLRSPEIVFLD